MREAEEALDRLSFQLSTDNEDIADGIVTDLNTIQFELTQARRMRAVLDIIVEDQPTKYHAELAKGVLDDE